MDEFKRSDTLLHRERLRMRRHRQETPPPKPAGGGNSVDRSTLTGSSKETRACQVAVKGWCEASVKAVELKLRKTVVPCTGLLSFCTIRKRLEAGASVSDLYSDVPGGPAK